MKKFLTFILIVLFSIVALFLGAEFNLIDLAGAYNNSLLFNRIVNNGLSIDDKNLNNSNGKEKNIIIINLVVKLKIYMTLF